MITTEGLVSPQRLPYQSEDGSPILRNHLHPRQPPQHREIDTAKTQACQEDVDAITQRLTSQRVDSLRQGLRTVGVGAAIFHFFVSFLDRHLQRRVGHCKWDKLLPMLRPRKPAGSLQSFVQRRGRKRSQQPENGQSSRPVANLLECTFSHAYR